MKDLYVYSYVPRSGLSQVKEHGLHSSLSLRDRPDLLEVAAKARGQSPEDMRKGIDEDKVMLGFKSKVHAREAYLAHYDDPKFLGPISALPVEYVKARIAEGKKIDKLSSVVLGAMRDEPYKIASSLSSRVEFAKIYPRGRLNASC